MEFLLFQIYAPLVSWGGIAVGGERQSSRHPSKSAIVGLISAALGIKRDEEDRLNTLAKSIGVAVQLNSAGTVLKDFHTVQAPKQESKVVHYTRQAELLASPDKIGTILSRREYRCDSLSVVGIYLKDALSGVTLQQIAEALREPAFHLYFGRKSSAPALPLAPKIVEGATLKDVFAQYAIAFVPPVSEKAPEWLQKAFESYPTKTLFDKELTYYWEEGVDSGLNATHSVERYDQPSSRKRWQFTTRREYSALVRREEASNVSV